MPSVFENTMDDDSLEYNSPVVSLKEGLHVRELMDSHQTEFEVRPDEDDEITGENSAEACFSFEELERVVNLDVIDVDNDSHDDNPFDKYRRKMHNLRADGKIKKYEVRPGVGPLVPDNSVVYIRYQAYVEYQEVPFDSTLWQGSADRDLPVAFNLGRGQVLPGLHEALLSMRKAEKAEFLVHPDLAYGSLGCPPRIPQDATVLFIVEVDRFVDCGDIHNPVDDDLSMEDRLQFCNIHKKAKGHYMLANDDFSKGNYSAAATKYRKAINMMHNARLANQEEEEERNRFLIKNYTNSCLCFHNLKNYKRVCSMATDAVHVSQPLALNKPKLLYYWGYAKMMLNDYEGSKKHLLAAKKISPNDIFIEQALKDLAKRKSNDLLTEKMMMMKAFGSHSSGVKLTEITDEDEQFRSNVQLELEEFLSNSKTSSMTVKESYPLKEEKLYLEVVREMGLYGRVVDGDKRLIHIKKPDDV